MPASKTLIPEDGIIDELAISITVSGLRRVRLTPAERDIAALRIIRGGADVADLALKLGTSPKEAHKLVRDLGYRLSAPSGDVSKHRDIIPAAA